MNIKTKDDNINVGTKDNNINVETKDGKIYNIPDLNMFSKYPESIMWQTLMGDGPEMFFIFIHSYLTRETLDAIVVFHERDMWPYKPLIEDVHDPFDFLGLPRAMYNSDDGEDFMSSDDDRDDWWD